MLKKTFIGFCVVIAVLLGVAVIAPSFIDWNARLPEIAAEVKNATGRDLSLDGKLEVRILPAPMLTARGVKLGNMVGGTAAHMVELDAVEIRVALLPLLSGQLQVERINLVNPVITIEKLADGRSNLDFQSQTPPTGIPESDNTGAQETLQKAESGQGVRLDNFEIKNARLIYLDGANGSEQRVENLDATLRAASLQGPFEAKGQAKVRGIPVSFDVSLGQIIAQRTVPLDASVQVVGGPALHLAGALLGLEADPYFKGKAKVTGDNLAALLDRINGEGGTPVLLARNFGLDSTVNASATAIDLTDLELQFAATRATGAIGVDLTKGPEFSVQLKTTHMDVDEILAFKGSSRTSTASSNQTSSHSVAPQPPANSEQPIKAAGFAIPKGVSGTVQVVVDALTVKGGLVRDVRLNAELTDGEVALNQFQLQAPGVTDLALFGFVHGKDGEPKFEGNLELLTSDPQGLTNWLGVQLPQGVSNRLKRLSFATKVQANSQQVMLSEINLIGDRSTLTGGATVALRARPSLGVDLSLDTLDLDSYLNGNGNSHGAQAASPDAALATSPDAAPASAEATPSKMDVLKIWSALNALNDFDANVKVRVGDLKLKGKTYKKLLADGTLYAGKLDLRDLSLGDVQGASGKVSGSFSGFGGVVEMTDVKVASKIKNASSLALSFGVQGVPKDLKRVNVTSDISGSVLKPRFNTNVEALNGVFGAKGSFSVLPFGFGYDGTVRAKHPDTAKFLKALKIGYAPKGPLGTLDFQAKLRTDGKVHTVTELNGAIGDMALSGDIQAKTNLDKPNIVATLKTGELKLDAFLPRPQAKTKKQAAVPSNPLLILAAYQDQQAVNVAQVDVAQVQRADKRWSREAFDLSMLNQITADVTLVSEAIQFGDYRLADADIHASVNDGVMTADRVQGKLFGGPISGTAKVRADGQPTLQTDISLSALDVSQAMKVVTGKDLAGGKLALNVGFKAVGYSPAELVSSLGGRGDMNIAGLDAKQSGGGSALSGVIGLVTAMNKLSLGTAGPGKGLADIGLNFDVDNGIATVKDFALTSGLGGGQGAGTVDLAAWTIDFAGKMKMEANLLTALLSKGRVSIKEIPFSLKGALDKPGVKFATAPVSGQGQPAQIGSPLQQMMQQVLPGIIPSKPKTQAPAPQPAPQDGTLAPPPSQQGSAPAAKQPSGKLTPEEMIRRLMQGM